MCPLTLKEVESYRKSGFKHYPMNPDFINWLRTSDKENKNPYAFRDKASREIDEAYNVGRAFYHIAQRRGFLSNRLDQSDEGVLEENSPLVLSLIEDLESNQELRENLHNYLEDKGVFDTEQKTVYIKDQGDKVLIKLYKSLLAILIKNETNFSACKDEMISKLNQTENLGKVKGGIHDLTAEMKEKGYATLGQLFHSKYSKEKIRSNYTGREEHYLSEFEIICKIQEIEGVDSKEKLPEKRYSGLAKDLYKAIFYQRPLKSQKGLIGKCSFEPNRSRCAISHPDFEEFRMWNFINTIKMGLRSDKTLRFLTQGEKDKLVAKFFRKKESFNFEDLAKDIVPKGKSFGFYKSSKRENYNYWFNYNSYDTVSGCPVSASLKSVFGDQWKEIETEYLTKDALGKSISRKVNYHDLWHLLLTSTSDEYLIDFANSKLGLDNKMAKAFSKIRLKKDFASLSLNAIRKILPFIREGLLYSHAVFMANMANVVDSEIWNSESQQLDLRIGLGLLIENHSFENAKMEIINGIIKTALDDKGFLSKESEPIFTNDLKEGLKKIGKR
jgi:CRISPR-associated endonuclease Csn1